MGSGTRAEGSLSMEKRELGRTGMQVSRLGFGGAEIGYEKASDRDVDAIVAAAIDAGVNVFDTAECYLDSEEKLGRALQGRRDQVFVFTKCGHASGLDGEDWSPDMLSRSIDRSLQNLRSDCVDLLQLHSCSEEVLRRGDVIEVLERARAAGKTRFIGYSGDAGDALYAVQSGRFDTLQTSVSIADQESVDLTLPRAKEAGMGVIAKRAIANAAWKTGRKPDNPYHHEYWDRLTKLQYPFLNGADAVSTALRFTLAVPGVDMAIVGTKSPQRWVSNSRLLDAGPLPTGTFGEIRRRWRKAAEPGWVGQV